MSTALLHQNISGQNELTVRTLRTQALGFGITAVLCGTAALLMREKLNIYL